MPPTCQREADSTSSTSGSVFGTRPRITAMLLRSLYVDTATPIPSISSHGYIHLFGPVISPFELTWESQSLTCS
ncbi:hypothetical protein BST61_g9538 [Cercospora zeina]